MRVYPVLEPQFLVVDGMSSLVAFFLGQLQEHRLTPPAFGKKNTTFFKALPYSAHAVCRIILMKTNIVLWWKRSISRVDMTARENMSRGERR